MNNQCQHLTEIQCNEWLKWLLKLEELLYVTLGTQKTDPEDSELKEDVNPICSQPHPVMKAH